MYSSKSRVHTAEYSLFYISTL